MRRLLSGLLGVLLFVNASALAQDPLPPGAIKRLGTDRLRHGSRILCARFSPDGKLLACGGGNDPVRIWDAESGRLVKELKDAWVNELIFSSRGTRLITASAFKTIREWDLTNSTEAAQLKGHEAAVTAMAISRDNTLLATADQSGAIILWELFLSPKQLRHFTGHSAEVNSLAFSADGRTLASASSDRSIRLWNLEGSEAERVLDGGCCVKSLVFLLDGRLASAGDDSQIRIWDTTAGKQVAIWTGHEDTINTLLLSADGHTLVSGSRDKSVRLWNTMDGKAFRTIERDPGDCDVLALSNDGKALAAAGVNNTIRRWDLETGKELDRGPGHSSPVSQVALSPDGRRIASVGRIGDIRIWDPAEGTQLRQLLTTPGDVLLAYAADGTLASARDSDVHLWLDGVPKRLATPAGDRVLGLAFAPDSKSLALGHRSGAVRLWDVAQGKQIAELKYPGPAYTVAYSHDGTRLAASGDLDIVLWDVTASRERAQPELRRFAPKETALQPAVARLIFSPDDTLLATGSFDSVIRLWDIEKGVLVRTIEGHSSAVAALRFSPDGRHLASGSFDSTVRLWETHGGRPVAVWRGHRGPVTSVVVGVDGRTVISGSSDTSLLVWDVTGKSVDSRLAPLKLTYPELQARWQTLASQNATEANLVIWDMVAASQDSLPFLQKSIFLLEQKKLADLIRDLDSPLFLVRDQASSELANFGRWIESTLEQRIKEPGSEEMRRRIGRLLEKLRVTGALTAEQEVLRYRRAMLVLEQEGGPAAQDLLRKITTNGPEPYLQAEAPNLIATASGTQTITPFFCSTVFGQLSVIGA